MRNCFNKNVDYGEIFLSADDDAAKASAILLASKVLEPATMFCLVSRKKTKEYAWYYGPDVKHYRIHDDAYPPKFGADKRVIAKLRTPKKGHHPAYGMGTKISLKNGGCR